MSSRRLDWTTDALVDLEEFASYSPAAARRVVEAIEAMAVRGFNYGIRLRGDPPRWYWPERPAAIYYTDDGTTLRVIRVADGRRSQQLPPQA